MKTSVVITSFNHEAFVGEAIDSVLSQTLKPEEVIVVDDCSTDASLGVIKKFERHIKVVSNTRNLGGARTASTGIEMASGDLVAMLNSDDKWEASKLQKQLHFMSENKLDCSFTTAQIIDSTSTLMESPPQGLEVFQRKLPINGNFLFHFLNHGNFLCHSSMLAKRSLFEKTGFYDARLKQLPDYSKWIDFAKIGKIGIVPEDLTFYRYLGSRNTSSIDSLEVAARTKLEHLLVFKGFFTGIHEDVLCESFPQALPEGNIEDRVRGIIQIFLSIQTPPLKEVGSLAALIFSLDHLQSTRDSDLLLKLWGDVF